MFNKIKDLIKHIFKAETKDESFLVWDSSDSQLSMDILKSFAEAVNKTSYRDLIFDFNDSVEPKHIRHIDDSFSLERQPEVKGKVRQWKIVVTVNPTEYAQSKTTFRQVFDEDTDTMQIITDIARIANQKVMVGVAAHLRGDETSVMPVQLNESGELNPNASVNAGEQQ